MHLQELCVICVWLYRMFHITNLTTLDCVPIRSLSKSRRCWWLRSPVSLFSLSRATQNWAPISSSSLVPIWRPWRHIKEKILLVHQNKLSHSKTLQSYRLWIYTYYINNFKALTQICFGCCVFKAALEQLSIFKHPNSQWWKAPAENTFHAETF